ncbi:MAG: pyridoxal-phosphate dependent enzyme [Anaerolineales bacterium]
MSSVFPACQACRQPYPSTGFPFRCPACGSLFDYLVPWTFDLAAVESAQPGIFRYRHTFGLPPEAQPVSLGEGGTPLVWGRAFGRQVAFKCEFLNPTGSFKDRGSALMVTWLKWRGQAEAVEDSSGNAGASFAAYAARAGLRARVFVPASASGPKRAHILACGADLVPVAGSRSDVTEAVLREAERGVAYASHAALPFNLPGYATAAYEIFEQLGGEMPGAVIVPAGQGGLLVGLSRGFEALRVAKINRNEQKFPKMVAVQARACAPLWSAFVGERDAIAVEKPTLAEGVRVRRPLRLEAVLSAVTASGGMVVAVEERAILPGRDALARLGFYVEPTSALVWSALEQALAVLPDPLVVILTGSGYKYAP